MRAIRYIAAAAFLFASSAQAALISVTADVGWYAIPFEGVVIPEYGTMNLVYDTSVTDSDPSATTGRYDGAIVSFVMTVEQQNRPDLFFTLTPGPTSISVYSSAWSGDTGIEIALTATEHSGAYGAASNMPFFGRVIWPGHPFGDLLPAASDWHKTPAGPFAYVAYLGPALETDWAWNFRAVTLVPAPGSAALLLLGACVLAGGGFTGRRFASGAKAA